MRPPRSAPPASCRTLVPGRHRRASSMRHARPRSPTGCSCPPRPCSDFQLRPGDLIRLRLQDGRTKQYTTVPFHYVGRREGVPDRAHATASSSRTPPTSPPQPAATPSARSSSQTDGTRPGDRRAPAPRGRSAPAPRSPTSSTSAQVVGSEPHRGRARRPDAVELGFALVLAVAATGLALGARLRTSGAARSRSPARSAPDPRQLGGVRLGRVGVRHRRRLLLGAAIAAGDPRDARQGPHRRLRPAARRPDDPVGLPRGGLLLCTTGAAVVLAGTLTSAT